MTQNSSLKDIPYTKTIYILYILSIIGIRSLSSIGNILGIITFLTALLLTKKADSIYKKEPDLYSRISHKNLRIEKLIAFFICYTSLTILIDLLVIGLMKQIFHF